MSDGCTASSENNGENYNIGVVTLTNTPYTGLTEAMKITNERIYKVGTGLEEPYKADMTRIPSIHCWKKFCLFY